MESHQEKVYKLVQDTLNFCGNTLEVVKDYCQEHGLYWQDYESVRFQATKDFYEKR